MAPSLSQQQHGGIAAPGSEQPAMCESGSRQKPLPVFPAYAQARTTNNQLSRINTEAGALLHSIYDPPFAGLSYQQLRMSPTQGQQEDYGWRPSGMSIAVRAALWWIATIAVISRERKTIAATHLPSLAN
jgi:hypothetical protein